MAGQNADMTLKVGLDLNFFRQELQKASSALAGQQIDINVRFNRSKITNELRLLSNSLSRKKYDVEVKSTSLEALLRQVNAFKQTLAALKKEDVSLNVKVESSISGAKAAEARRDIISKITGPKGAIFVPIEVKPPLVKNINAIRKGIKDSLSGIVIEVEAKLKGGIAPAGAAGVSGGEAGQTRRPSFLDSPAYQAELNKIAKANAQALAKAAASLPSGRNRQEVERLLQAFQAQNPQGASRTSALGAIRDLIARGRYQQGLGFEASLQPLRGQRQASAARSMPNLNEMLDRMANLTSNPRAAQRMLRALPESRITTDLVGAANRQAAFQQQFPQGFTLPGFNAPKAFDPLLKAIAKDFSDYARTVNISDPWVGQVSNGIANVIAKAAASPQVTRLLPAAGQTSASRMTQQMFTGLPALQAPGIGMENAPLSRAGQYMLNKARRALELPIGPASPYAPNPFAGQATIPSRQYFQPTMRPALPAAGGTSGLLSALEAQLGASRGMLGTGGGIATSLFTGRGLVNPGVSMLEPVGLSGNYRQMAAALANQAANPALAHRQIADIGFGGVPTSATGLSGQALNAALNQAFLQRRGLGISGAQSLPIFGTGGVAVQQNIPGMAYQMGGGGLGGSMGQFPMAGMMGPSTPLSINARTSMFGGGGGMQPPGGGGGFGGFGGASGFGGFGRAMGGINLPGAGTIRELGDEFGFATKQVLLFGQAYKLLGFIQSFPGQVATAVSALQSFRNTLGAISPTAKEAQLSNELILALVEKYNIPLESARQGFTKLYASMQPAGFSGAEISKLFTGISKASATLGLSSDKVDRVTYAFSQMASKGQLMSEEVSGQLGDVIPGALSIMAEAAGMDIGKFKKAMEDGEFVGTRFTEVMNKVPEVLEKRFGKGAEGAAKTFQGAMNNMQTSVTLFYESFEPAAVAFLNMFVTPISRQLKDLADGFTAFFSKTNAQTIGGQSIADELNKLRPAFEGIIANMQAFVPTLKTIGDVALGVAKAFTVIAGNPITGMLAKVYVQILLLTTAFKILTANAIAQTIRSLIGMVTQIGLTNNAMVLLQKNTMSAQMQMALLTAKTGNMAGAFKSGSLAVTGLGAAIKSALLGGVITAAILIIDQLINRIQRLRAEAEAVGAKGKGARAEVKAAYAGGVESGRSAAASKEAEARSAAKLSGIYRKLASATTGGGILTAEEIQFAREMGADLPQFTGKANQRGLYGITKHNVPGPMAKGEYERLSLQQAQTAQSIRDGIAQGSREGEEYAAAQAARTAKEQRKLEEDLSKDKAKNSEKLANQAQQLAIDAANRQNALDKARLQGLMALDDLGFQHQINLIDARNEYELAGLNSIQARQEKFQQDLQKLELNRIDIVRKAEQNATKAIAEYRAAQNTVAASESGTRPTAGGKLPGGMTQYITGDPSSPYYKADHGGSNYHEHLAFASRALAEAAYQQLTKAGVQVTEFKGRSPVGRHTPGSAHYSGLAFDVPGAQVPIGQEKQLTAKVQSILGIGGGGYTQQRRTEKAGGKLEVEQTQMYMEAEKATREAVMATTEALEKRKALIAGNIDAIFPVAQQRLENDLLKIRNDLQLKGMPEEYIKYQEDLAKTNYEMGERIKNNTEETARYEKEVAALQERQQKGIKLTETEKQALQFYTQAIAQNKDELNKLTEQQKQYQIAALESAIATMKNADAMKALQETSERINQSVEGVTGTYEDMFKEIAKGGDSVEALKKAQEALADQALTMFFDFAMQPVEKFFKDQLGAIFGVPNEEQQRQKTISAMEAQLKELQAQKQIQTDIKNNTDRMVGAAPGGQQAQALPGAMSSAIVQGIDVPIDQMPAGMQFEESIGAATENLNTATEGVAETVNKTAEKTKEANIDWQKALGATVQGIGVAAGSIMGIAAGINQAKEGGFANTLGGIGMIMSSVGGLLGGFSNIAGMFGGGGGASAIVQGVDIPASALPPGMAFANGGIARGGFIPFRAFANGGAVSGPTLGLVGEGRYNEAIVPLPDGRSIPVQLGGKSARDLMGGNAPGMPAAPSLNMKFETTKINGVEYVSREQLEMAMAETRRASISGGAKQGMAMTLDKIKQSPSTRSRIGMR
jgi:tape measure domain-containing protein